MKNSRRLAEKEKQHCADGKQCNDHTESNQNCHNLEDETWNRQEIFQLSFADFTAIVKFAELPDSHPSRTVRFQISYPFWSYEDHNADDGEADSEYGPQNTNCLGIPDVVRRVHMPRFHIFDLRTHFKTITLINDRTKKVTKMLHSLETRYSPNYLFIITQITTLLENIKILV